MLWADDVLALGWCCTAIPSRQYIHIRHCQCCKLRTRAIATWVGKSLVSTRWRPGSAANRGAVNTCW